jgi:type III secretory pathway component EscU
MATAGFVLSLVSIFLSVLIVPVILGVIFSAIGISRANEFERTTGQPIGRGLAVAGLVISLIMVFFSFLWLVFWI